MLDRLRNLSQLMGQMTQQPVDDNEQEMPGYLPQRIVVDPACIQVASYHGFEREANVSN